MDKLPRNYVLKRGGIGVIFVKGGRFWGDSPPITLFNAGISHYYIYARRDGILTLLGVGKGTFRWSGGGRKVYASKA